VVHVVILPPMVQRGGEGLERRVVSSPSPQHLVLGWIGQLVGVGMMMMTLLSLCIMVECPTLSTCEADVGVYEST
jgi:hypothetical protein